MSTEDTKNRPERKQRQNRMEEFIFFVSVGIGCYSVLVSFKMLLINAIWQRCFLQHV